MTIEEMVREQYNALDAGSGTMRFPAEQEEALAGGHPRRLLVLESLLATFNQESGRDVVIQSTYGQQDVSYEEDSLVVAVIRRA